MNLYTINEIEKIKSVSSPHEKELKDFGEKWRKRLRKLSEGDVEKICELLICQRDSVDMDEEWTITKEFFPEVRCHILYHFYGEEFSEFGEKDAVRFLFSGNRVQKVTGEDLAGMVGILLNFMEKFLKDESPRGKVSWEMKSKHFDSREKPFRFLKKNDLELMKELSDFLGSTRKKTDTGITFHKEIFKGVEVEIALDDGFDISFSGDNLDKMTGRDLDSYSIFLINHIIRFIAIKNEDKDLPDICLKVFP